MGFGYDNKDSIYIDCIRYLSEGLIESIEKGKSPEEIMEQAKGIGEVGEFIEHNHTLEMTFIEEIKYNLGQK